MDDGMWNRLENAVGKLLDRVGELREENGRLAEDRKRLESEVQKLKAEIAGRSRSDDDVVRLKKENDLYKRKTRIVRDHVERMLSRFQTLEE
jgi:regulator of replication initiation timing